MSELGKEILNKLEHNEDFRTEIIYYIEEIEYSLTDILVNLAKLRRELKNV